MLQIQLHFSIADCIMFLIKAWRASAFAVYGYLNFTQSAFLQHSKKFKEEDMQSRLDGQNCIVTGANSGIGFATAEGLAARGASVYMVCRSKERGETALSQIQSKTGNQNVYLEVCDLSSVSEIKSFADKFTSKELPVHLLVNNAGILEHKRIMTLEGFELNFAVNVLGTYTLTELMLPLLEKAAPDARVITVSSGGMYTSPLTIDLQFSEGEFNGMTQYGRNKRVQVALTEKWAEKYKDKGIGFYSMHPGWAGTPGVAKSYPGTFEQAKKELTRLYGWLYNQKTNWCLVDFTLIELKRLNTCLSQLPKDLMFSSIPFMTLFVRCLEFLHNTRRWKLLKIEW
uniref:Dehydrogenase/reductase SDR family member 12 n=1 Tax=Opuntia streptacantha TaxID=393608 RepID=A0A7C9D729_OPUST